MRPDDLADLLVAELARGGEEAFARGLGDLNGPDVRKCQVAHIDPDVRPGFRDLLLAFALQEVAGSFVGGVEAVEGVEVVHDGAHDQRWVYCG